MDRNRTTHLEQALGLPHAGEVSRERTPPGPWPEASAVDATSHHRGEAWPAILQGKATNVAPVANAGLDQNAVVGQRVELDAGRVSDAEGDELAIDWSLTRPPSATMWTAISSAFWTRR